MSYTIETCSIEEILADVALLEDNWTDVAKNKELMVLSPDREKYLMLEANNQLICIAAKIDGVLVGYSVNILQYHLHYSNLFYCNNDVIYLHSNLRDNPLGLRLIKRTEQLAKERGAKLMLWHAKENTALDKLLRRMNCKVQDIIHSKEL